MSNGSWDAFLKVDGIKGESQRAGHKDEIELVSFDFGGTNPSSIGHGSGGGTGTVRLSSFNFLKKTDAASPELFMHMCQGKHFPTAKITMYKSSGDASAPVDYLVFEFEECYVENLNWSGAQGGDQIPTESVSMAFRKVTITYNTQDKTGKKTGAVVGSWDVGARTT
jgi:type VI secretion system secreted protein Hcp